MEAEGVVFRPGVRRRRRRPDAATLQRDFDAVVLAVRRAGRPRDLPIPGRELEGHPLRDGLPAAAEPALRRRRDRRRASSSRAEGQARRHHRRRRHRRRLPRHGAPPGRAVGAPARAAAASRRTTRAADNPWPQWPQHLPRLVGARRRRRAALLGVDAAVRRRRRGPRPRRCTASQVEAVSEDGRLAFKPVPGTEFELPADLVLLAMGFTGAERSGLLERPRRRR